MASTVKSMCSRPIWRALRLMSPISGQYSKALITRLPQRQLSNKAENSNEAEDKRSAESILTEEVNKGTTTENQLVQKVEELQSQIDQLNDKYKRALAETENVRLRMSRQTKDAKMFGIQDFCKELLEVADILGKATESVPSHELSDGNPHLKNLFEGLKMTEAHLNTVFRRHGLAQINPIGEKFDPNKHEALFEQVVQGKDPGTIVVVTKVGYALHERTIRPALVGVAKI